MGKILMPKVIIVDLGGVLFCNKDSLYGNALLEAHKESGKSFLRDWDLYEKGFLKPETLYKSVERHLGFKDNYEMFEIRLVSGIQVDARVYEFLRELSEKYRFKIHFWTLSNIGPVRFLHILDKWQHVLWLFSKWFMSFKIGYRKPSPEIYISMINRTKRKFSDCLFIDDRVENGAYPQSKGMQFIHFKNLEQLQEKLKDYGISLD